MTREQYATKCEQLLEAGVFHGLIEFDPVDHFARVIWHSEDGSDIGEWVGRIYLRYKRELDLSVRTLFAACEVRSYEEIELPGNFAVFLVEFLSLVPYRFSESFRREIIKFVETCDPRISDRDLVVLLAIVSVFGIK